MNAEFFLFSLTISIFVSISSAFAWPTSEVASRGAETKQCLRCHGNVSAPSATEGERAPLLPLQFSARWKMHEFVSNARPPFSTEPPQSTLLPGETHYDWNRQSMTEIYPDKCIDIFPEGREFPCRFTSVADHTYFMKYSGRGTGKPVSCCRWGAGPFWAPRPDVIRHMNFDQKKTLREKPAQWWMLDIPPPGPFGYGFLEKGIPAAFWFPVNSGWVQQNFYEVDLNKGEEKYFSLPEICQGQIRDCD